ncbi:Hydroxyacid dehydrogenase [Paraburkholderia tropica]|uniref:hydroxyacid dehydrogenase n=1 Tax=Paraburkholderia tropica TaxID=92647 RepID=UPI001CAC039A|nr:hydroxyacid dehydrogenase [Paraburkholderia tropica]CAG9213823.1 Hydroxyacid dehydrogenase [Paraburkholderia tropica]
MSYRILVTAPRLAPAGQRVLAAAQCETVYIDDAQDAAQVARILATQPIDAVISRTVELSGAAIAACPTLRVICKHGVGVTNIDVDAATQRGIPVFTTPGTNTHSVAELAIGLMLAAARKLNFFDSELRAGRWTRTGDGRQLHGRTLGLVGYGQIGQRVAAIAHALGLHVRAFDPVAKQADAQPFVTLESSLDALLAQADVLSLHCPVNAHTRNLLDAEAIARLPDGAIVVNTARGELIDEAALVAALRSGKLAAAGLDTFRNEPMPADDPLAALPNVVLTPHVGGSTPDALDAVAVSAAETCLRFLRGEGVDSVNAAACVNGAVLKHHQSDIKVIA